VTIYIRTLRIVAEEPKCATLGTATDRPELVDRATLVGRTCIFILLIQNIRVQISSMKYINGCCIEHCTYMSIPIPDATFTLGGHDSHWLEPSTPSDCQRPHHLPPGPHQISIETRMYQFIPHPDLDLTSSEHSLHVPEQEQSSYISLACLVMSLCPGLGGQKIGELCLTHCRIRIRQTMRNDGHRSGLFQLQN
jgi:hypothetical protein